MSSFINYSQYSDNDLPSFAKEIFNSHLLTESVKIHFTADVLDVYMTNKDYRDSIQDHQVYFVDGKLHGVFKDDQDHQDHHKSSNFSESSIITSFLISNNPINLVKTKEVYLYQIENCYRNKHKYDKTNYFCLTTKQEDYKDYNDHYDQGRYIGMMVVPENVEKVSFGHTCYEKEKEKKDHILQQSKDDYFNGNLPNARDHINKKKILEKIKSKYIDLNDNTLSNSQKSFGKGFGKGLKKTTIQSNRNNIKDKDSDSDEEPIICKINTSVDSKNGVITSSIGTQSYSNQDIFYMYIENLLIEDKIVSLKELIRRMDTCPETLDVDIMNVDISTNPYNSMRGHNCNKVIEEYYFPLYNTSINKYNGLNIIFNPGDRYGKKGSGNFCDQKEAVNVRTETIRGDEVSKIYHLIQSYAIHHSLLYQYKQNNLII